MPIRSSGYGYTADGRPGPREKKIYMNDEIVQKPEAKTCGSCGEHFGCGARLDGCWCADLTLAAKEAADIRSKFGDCLCPNCLGAISEGPAMIVKYQDGTIEILSGAVRVDSQNFHEGMFDFYDDHGTLLRQIDMSSDISWESVRGIGS